MRTLNFKIGKAQLRCGYESLKVWRKRGYPLRTWIFSTSHLKVYIFRARGLQVTILGFMFGVFLNPEVKY